MKPKTFLAKSIATLLATTITLTSALHALPQGEQVQAGSASFSRAGGALDIRTSDRAIINYQSFSIGSAERVNFIQPSVQSITLNRVTAPNPSQIFGTLTSNGQIVLANPYGIFFQSGSVVNVGGLIAGAGQISNSDFLAGRINFSSLSGDVENHGNITAITDVGLYGEHVSNTGSITSQKGSVTLAAGSSVYVGEAGGNIFVGSAAAIPKARVVSKPGVSNTGRITAPKTNLVAGDMYGIAIAQSGDIISGDITIAAGTGGSVDVSGRLDASNRAPGKTGGKIKVKGDTVTVHDATLDASGGAGGGTVLLEGGHNPTMPTTVTSSGRLLARGEGTGAKGGTVQMTGDHVGLLGSAVVDVSGDAGGGTALIGGDYQGRNPNVQNAERTYISLGAQIYADALSIGNGGKVIIWADDVTRFYGSISARGGAQSGNGGFVETSGARNLEFFGTVDTSAPHGAMGSLLLDPTNLFIINGASGAGDQDANIAANALPFGAADTAANTVSVGKLQSLGNVNITLQAKNTLTVGASGGAAANVDLSATLTSNTLTLQAGDAATVGGGNLVFNAGSSISTGGGGVTLIAGDATTQKTGTATLGAISTSGGAISVIAQQGMTLNGALNSGAGTVSLIANQGGAGANNFTMTAGSSILTTNATAAAVAINVNAAGGGTGGAALRNITTGAGGTITVATDTGANATGGSITQTAATLLNTGAAGTVTLRTGGAASGIGTLAANILTTADTITAGTGSGGVFITETNGASFTATATLAGDIRLTSTSGTLNIAGATATGTGNIILSSGDDVTLNANVGGAGSGTITISANTDGAGAQGFAQSVAAGTITTTNATAAAVTINVNAAGGGTGGAALRNITTGAGGTLTVATNTGANATGGSITQTAATALNVGAAGTLTLSVPTAGASGVGTVANNILSTSAGGTLNLTAGSGGAFVTNTGNLTLAAPTLNANSPLSVTSSGTLTLPAVAISTGTGDLTLRSNGGALTTAGALSTTSGSITLVGSGGLSIGHNLTTTLAAGNLTLTSTNNPINQTLGTIAIAGTTTASAGTGAITLAQLLNDFTGAVSASNTGANAIQLRDVNAIVLGTVSTANNLTVNAVGITQDASGLTVGGTSLFSGGAGAITLTTAGNDFTGAVSANNTGANAIQITDTNAIVLGTVNTANNLTVNAVGITQNAGGLTVGGTSTFNGGAAAITLLTAINDFTGAVSLNNSGANAVAIADANAIVLGASTVGQNLAVTAKGAISQTGALVVPGTSAFTIDTALLQDVLLAGFNNNLTGAVTIATTGGATLRDVALRNISGVAAVPLLPATLRNLDLQFINTAVTVPTINLTGTLNVLAGGAITQAAGGVQVTGVTTLNSGANAITLTDALNDFTGAVSANNTGANAIQLTDTNAIVLGTVNTANNLTLNAVGITQNAGGLTVGGTSTFNGGAGVITLTTAGNDFTGALSANNTGANAIQLTDTNAIVLGTVNTANNLTVNAVGITQNAGGLIVTGTSTFNGGAGAITLTTVGNNFTGPVSANNTGANAIQLTDTNAIVLGTVNTANNLTVNAVGITQNAGGLTVGGTSTFNGGAAAITLLTAINDFTGAVSLNNSGANAVAIADANAIVLGASTVGQNLAVTAKGAISQTGALVVPGTSAFTIDTALLQDVLLAGFNNNLTGAVTIATTGGATLRDVALRNISGVAAVPLLPATLRNLDLQFINTAVTVPTINLTGTLNVLAGGAITQAAGGVQVTGVTTLNSGANAITLTDALNDFTGAVSFTNSGANTVRITDANDIVLGASTVGQNLFVNVKGNISQTGALVVPGTSTFTVDTGLNKDVLLAGFDNNFTGTVTIATTGGATLRDVGLRNINAVAAAPVLPATLRNLDLQFINAAVAVPTINLTGTLNVLAGGAITQAAGGVQVTGVTTLNSGANAITLTDAANNFTGAVSASNTGANAIQLRDVNAIVLGNVNTGNNLTVSAVGITQNAAGLTVGGTSTFNGGAGVITLTTAANDFTGAVSANNTGANAIQLTDTNAIVLGAVNTANNLTVNAVGITQNAAGLTIGGASTFNGGAAAITLTTAANDFTGAVSANNTGLNAIQITDTNAIVLGAVNTANDLTVSAVGITQNAAGLTIGGASTFNGGAAAITLTTAANDFTGAVSANNTGLNAIQLTDTNAIVLGAVNTTNDLTVNAVGITQNAAGLAVVGTSTFNGGAGVITLTAAGNDFFGPVNANNTGPNAIQLTDVNAIVLGNVNTANNLTVSAVGITQNAAGLTVVGTSLFNGGAGVITLTAAANDFTGAVSANNTGANAIQLTDTNAIVLGAVNTANDLTVSAVGITQNAAGLTVVGTSTFNGGAAAITLTTAANDFTGAVNANNTGANAIQLTDANAILLGTVTTANVLTVIAADGITQTAVGAITAATLNLTTTNASAVLNTATNFITNLGTVSLGTGALNLLDAGGLTVQGVVDATGGVTLNTSGTLAIDNAVNAGAGNVFLTATVGNITQSGAGVLTGALLSATSNVGSVLLDTLANNFATFTASAPGAGQEVRYRDTDAFAVAATGILVNAATGVVALQSLNAAGTASGAITQTGEILGARLVVRAAQPGGSATLTNLLNTPSVVAANVAGNFLYTNANPAGLEVGTVDGVLGITTPAAVTLTALQGNLTQTQAIVGPASSVSATSTLGAVDLTNAGNAFAALNGSSALNFSAVDSIGLTVSAAGVTANGGNVVNLTVNGAGNSLSLAGLVTGGTVNLFADTDITQVAAGGVVAPNFQAVATNGQVNLAAGAANNNVGTIAGRANLDFTYVDNNSPALSVGTVTTIGVASTTGDVVITAANGSLTVNQNVNAIAVGGDVTLQAQNNLVLNTAVSANPVNGVVGLTSVTGSIIENVGGTVSSSRLRANAATNVDLAQVNSAGGNGFAARGAAGFVAFINNGAILLDQVGATVGVTAGGAVLLANTAGDITQTANGIITAATGLRTQADAGSITLGQANLVTGNFAVVNTAAGDITLRNTGLINIGAVGPFATSVPIGTVSGITGGVTRFLSLISDTGMVTQDAGPLDRIFAGDLRVQTTGMNATLTNAANEIASVGTVALGAGKFTLVDSTLGLLVNGDVTANTGVDIRTSGGALSVTAAPGTVNANAGDIVLRSTDSDVLLAGVLTASGLVQLDAGGAITQTGGNIASPSLIARAQGNVTLNQTANEATFLAGSSATGTFSYRDATAITVGTVNDATTPVAVPVVGITTTNRDITVVGGALLVAGGVAINAPVNAGAGAAGGIVRLQTALGNITQTATITGSSLLANALTGSVSLGGATNNVAVSLAGSAAGTNGSFRFLNAAGITVDSILGDLITAPANGITTNNGDVAILTGGALALNRPINAGNGTVRLQANAGDITQTATGGIVASSLLVNANSAAGGVSLATPGAANDVSTLAGNSGTGGFNYLDTNAVTIGPVGADGSGANPGLPPFLPIGALTSITTTGPLILTSPVMLNFSVPLILGGSLVANAPIIDINGGGNPTVQTVGGQTYNGAVVLTDHAVLVDLAPAGAIRFLSTVDSDLVNLWSLTVNTAGLTEFNGLVGNTRALLSVDTDGFGSVRFNAAGTDLAPTVRTTAFQTYRDAAVLALDTVLSSALGGTLTFGSTVNSEVGTVRSLRVNSTGNEIFSGVVGGSLALLSLVADGDAALRGGQAQFNMTAPGAVNPAGVNAGSVTVNDTAAFNVGGSSTATPSVQTTAGAADAQTYNGAVILNADAVLKDTLGANIVFNSTVNSDTAGTPRALEVDTAGNEVFGGRLGNTFALRTLITDASNLGGNARFNAAGTTAAASVITTGLQTYNDDVRLGTDVVLQSTGSGAITFNRTVNSDAAGTPRALEVNTGGDEVFNGRVGDAAALRTLITDASNLGGNARFNAAGTTAAASVITTGLQTYNDDVRLGTDVVLQSTGSGAITFNRTVNSDAAGTPRALEVNTGGDEVFNGRVGDAAALRTLITDASNLGGNARFNAAGTTAAASVITTGLQTYNDDVRLGTDVVLQSTGSGAITFNRTVNSDAAGTPRALEVNTGGDEVFNGRVGDAAALRTLITDASNLGGNARFNAAGATAAASVITTGLQTYNDDVRLGTDVALRSTGSGAIRFNRTVNSDAASTPRALEVDTGGVTGFGDGGADNVGGIAALRSLLTDAGGTTEFNIAGGTNSVLTTNSQTYNDVVRLVRDTVLTSDSDQVTAGIQGSASANDIRFNSTVDSFTSVNPRSLTVNTSGVTGFGNGVGLEGDRVGGVNPLLSLTTDAGGRTVFNVVRNVEATVTTTKLQDFRDAVALTQNTLLLSTAGGDINLRSTVEANNNALQIHNIGTDPANPIVANAVLGATISNLAALFPQVAGTTTIGTAGTATIISTNSGGPNGVPSDLLFIGPVEILGNVTVAVTGPGATAATSSAFSAAGAGNLNSGKKLTFLSTVKGPGNLTVTADGVVAFAGNVGGGNAPLGFLDVTAPIIQIQNTRTQNDLKLRTTMAVGSDGSDGLVVLMGNTYTSENGSVLLNWDNRPVASKHATILSTAGDLTITAGGQFFMGSQQKLLVDRGSLTITAGGAATIGDMAALTSMRLTASSVFLQGRPLSGITNQGRTDKGLGFVSPSISFNTTSMAFLSGTNQKAVFSTKDSIASTPGTVGVSLELDKDIANQFGQQDILGQASLGIVQPIASGTLVTEPSKIQVVFVLEIPKLVELPESTFLSRADQDVLAKMGIYPREATGDENITVSLRRGVFRQPIEGKAQMDDFEYKVVVNRLTTAEVKAIVDAYTELAGKDFENLKKIATVLAEQVNKYQTATPGALGLDGFTKWLQAQRATDTSAEELSKNLDELASVFVRLARIGLTKKEVMICKLKICDELKEFLPNVDVWDVVPLVEGGANPPIQAPRPAMTAPPADVPPPAATPPAEGTPAPLPSAPLPPPPESAGPAPADAAATPAVPAPPAPDASTTPKAQ